MHVVLSYSSSLQYTKFCHRKVTGTFCPCSASTNSMKFIGFIALFMSGVFIRWNGMVEWNGGVVEYWNCAMTTPTERSHVTTITHSFVEK